MNWTALITQQVESVYGPAAKLIEMVDDKKLGWKPDSGNNWWTTGQLLRHIVHACGLTCRGFVTQDWHSLDWGIDPSWKPDPAKGQFMPPAEKQLPVKSKKEALEMLAKDKALTIAMLKEAGEKALAEKRSVAPWGGPESNLGSHFLSCVRHLDVHKSQLFYYMKLQGQPVNTMHMWGM